MKFNWLDSEKERYHRKAAGILKENGIDFLDVDRSKFGVREWNKETQRASEVVVYLTPYPYKLLTAKKKKMLEKIEGWECLDRKPGKREEKQIHMHSRLIIRDKRCKGRVREWSELHESVHGSGI